MIARHVRNWGLGGLAVALIATAGGAVLLPARASKVDVFAATAMTKELTGGPFEGLSVTVSKTENLINEVVEVTWSGAEPTETPSTFQRHFLQLMQCWGDDTDGPRPEQCQFGASSARDAITGIGAVTSRQLGAGGLVDPAETRTDSFVPFESVDGRELAGEYDTFSALFDLQTSNELPLAATRGDGTGQEFFEVQTGTEAPGLGCGALVTGPGEPRKGRSCWLVVVPRSDVEVDTSVRGDTERLQSSPLSATNWEQRLVFPLKFQPIGGVCPLDGTQKLILGQENATEAITRWQQSLCAAAGAVFDYSQLPDSAARSNLAGADPAMAIVGRPLESPPAAGTAVYAPIAVSGLGFAYILEVRTLREDPPSVRQREGQRITDLKLTPRLVAKLLSQSYTQGVTVVPEEIRDNPSRMEDDPEFLALNPQLEGVNKVAAASLWTILTPLNPADSTAQVWRWIGADSEAREFLAGEPDPHGMVVNPAWKGADLDRDEFAKLDQTCSPEVVTPGPNGELVQAGLCVPDGFPYAGDMHEAVQSANRGDTLAKNSWDAGAIPPVYKKGTPQAKGFRGIMVVSDTATAARYNLPMARLRNASGKFVAPTDASLLANVAQLKADASGVLAPDPTVTADDAYPLAVVSYAATVPAALDARERDAYAGFISYAYGPGQQPGVVPGSLPAGYAPMPKRLTDAAKAAAAAIKDSRPGAPTPTPGPAPGPAPGPGEGAAGDPPSDDGDDSVGDGGNGPNDKDGGNGGGNDSNPNVNGDRNDDSRGPGHSPGDEQSGQGDDESAGADTGSPTPSAQPGPSPPPSAISDLPDRIAALTPTIDIGRGRLSLLWLLLGGLFAAGAAQVVPRLRALQAGTGGVRPPRPCPVPDTGNAGVGPTVPEATQYAQGASTADPA